MKTRHFEFVTVAGMNDGCSHESISEPYKVTQFEVEKMGFLPGYFEECERCGASRYVR